MLEFCSLSSGSSGNSSILKLGKYKILIDAGISLRKLDQSFLKLNLDPARVDMIFLTHAHGDHARSITKFSAKYDKPVFMTRETYNALLKKEYGAKLNECKVNFLKKEFKLENTIIKVFRLPHIGHSIDGKDDAGGNVGFLFNYSSKKGQSDFKFAYFTDLGELPKYIYKEIKDSDFYFLEANHDVKWQRISRRPPQVIERNLSDFGHLSNEQAANILTRVITPDNAKRRTKAVMLAHISSECNSHVLAETTIRKILEKNKINDLTIKIAPEKQLSEYLKF